jgi:hypothetical protein
LLLLLLLLGGLFGLLVFCTLVSCACYWTGFSLTPPFFAVSNPLSLLYPFWWDLCAFAFYLVHQHKNKTTTINNIGWDEGVLKMSLGEKAMLHISSDYGYGSRGAPGAIPPNADLNFEVELLAIGTNKAPGFSDGGDGFCHIL